MLALFWGEGEVTNDIFPHMAVYVAIAFLTYPLTFP